MNVVIGSSYLWRDSAKAGIHAFGRYFLGKGCRVAWFTVPFSFLHFVKPTNLAPKRKKLSVALRPVRETYGQGVLINRVPFTPIHPFRFPPLDSYYISRSFLNWAIPSIKKLLQKDGVYIVDILMFDAGGLNIFYPVEKLSSLRIYRLSDLVAEIPNQVRGRIESEREIIKRVDLVLPVSESLYEEAVKIRGTKRGVYLLPNGVDLSLFQDEYLEPIEYKHIPRPRAIFVGALSGWFDWDLLKKLALMRPRVSFVVVGPGKVPETLPENVHLLGSRPHNSIPSYLQHADVGLILFKNLPRIKRVERPLKFYEYLAAGLPVVSVPYGSLQKMASFALFGDSADTLANALDEALEISGDMEERARRIREAERFSWENIFAKFEEILKREGVELG